MRAKRPVRLSVEDAQTISELVADLDGDDGGQLSLLEGEAIGRRVLQPSERRAVDALRLQIDRVLGLPPGPGSAA